MIYNKLHSFKYSTRKTKNKKKTKNIEIVEEVKTYVNPEILRET